MINHNRQYQFQTSYFHDDSIIQEKKKNNEAN